MSRPLAGRRQDYRWFGEITVRWNDIDVFGHVNNARYYEFFDTTVLRYLHEMEGAEFGPDRMLMVVAENSCRFRREILFTSPLEMGLRVDRLGTSSVRYGLAAFADGADDAAAEGHFVHVCLDPVSKRPAPLAPEVREHLQSILVSEEVPA